MGLKAHMPRSIMLGKSKRPKAIFFDVGGVLLSYSPWKKANRDLDQELLMMCPWLNVRQLHEVWPIEWDKQHHLAGEFETMRSQAEDSLYKALMGLDCRLTKANVRKALSAWYYVAERNAEAMPYAAHVLRELRSSGYRIGIITNADWNVIIPHLRRTGLLKYIDYKIVSSRIKSYKPRLRPFREALRASRLKPQETAMVGDRAELDVEPAKRLGMRAWLLDSKNGSGEAISNLKELLKILC